MQRRKDQVSRQRRLNADLGGFQVPDLTDEDDVRVLTEEAAQGAGKRQTDVRADLRLNDPVDVVLHGVLGGKNLHVRLVELRESGIKGRGFAAAGWTRVDDDSIGFTHELAEGRQLVVAHSDLLQAELHVGAVEHAEHNALPEHRRQHADAQVDGHPPQGQLDAPILGESPLGDVEVGHDLDPRRDGQRHVPRRRHHLVQHAVDAVAHLELIVKGFEVDVARLVLDGLEQHQVEELLDRVEVHHLLDFGEVDGVSAVVELGEVLVIGQLADQVGDRFLLPFGIEAVDGVLQLLGGA